MVGPVFWFSLLGMPGLLALGAVHAAARAMPEQSARFEEFGMAAARLNAALFVLPGLLAGALIALAASFTPDAQVVRAFAAMGSARNRYRTRRTDWPAAVQADVRRAAYLYAVMCCWLWRRSSSRRWPGSLSSP